MGIHLMLISVDGLHDRAARSDDGLDRGRSIRDHDEHEQAWISRGRASKHPRAAHFADRIIESGRAVAALPCVPTEDLLVELG